MSSSKQPTLSREQSLKAKPVTVRIIKREPLPDGGVRIVVPFRPGGLYRWLLRVPDTATKRFELDTFGLEVLDMCDGKRTVRHMIDHFAKAHQLNPHEAEGAVVTFLRTMIRRGIVVVPIEGEK